MIKALSTASTGLQAQQSNIARISNDLANVNTDGYKRSSTEFQDLLYDTQKKPGGNIGTTSQSPVGIQTGMGVKVGTTHKLFEQGPARMTYNPYDLMIEGNGFLQILLPQNGGETAYTRTGAFHIDAQGRMMTTNGALLQPQITIPSNALNIGISNSGEVKAQLPGGQEAILGQIPLYRFQNEQGLEAAGAGVYRVTSASGPAAQGLPGEDGLGLIQQGALEGSNVNVANSMVDMITTQRAYEMGTKVMGTVDQMLASTVNIK